MLKFLNNVRFHVCNLWMKLFSQNSFSLCERMLLKNSERKDYIMLRQKFESFIFKSSAFLLNLIGLKPATPSGNEALLFIHHTWGIEDYYHYAFIYIYTHVVDKSRTKYVAYNLIKQFGSLPEVSGRNLCAFFGEESQMLKERLPSKWNTIFNTSFLHTYSVQGLIEYLLINFEKSLGEKETYAFLALICDRESNTKRRKDVAALQKILTDLDEIMFRKDF